MPGDTETNLAWFMDPFLRSARPHPSVQPAGILSRRGLEYYEALLPAILGSLAGYVVSVLVDSVGLAPIFNFPPTPAIDQGQLGWAVLAGVAGAVVATTFTYLAEGLRRLMAPIGMPWRPAVGGPGDRPDGAGDPVRPHLR